jgi:hypothetical protein
MRMYRSSNQTSVKWHNYSGITQSIVIGHLRCSMLELEARELISRLAFHTPAFAVARRSRIETLAEPNPPTTRLHLTSHHPRLLIVDVRFRHLRDIVIDKLNDRADNTPNRLLHIALCAYIDRD